MCAAAQQCPSPRLPRDPFPRLRPQGASPVLPAHMVVRAALALSHSPSPRCPRTQGVFSSVLRARDLARRDHDTGIIPEVAIKVGCALQGSRYGAADTLLSSAERAGQARRAFLCPPTSTASRRANETRCADHALRFFTHSLMLVSFYPFMRCAASPCLPCRSSPPMCQYAKQPLLPYSLAHPACVRCRSSAPMRRCTRRDRWSG